MKEHISYLLRSTPPNIETTTDFYSFCLSFCTEDFIAINLPCRYGVCEKLPSNSASKGTKTVCKKVKMTQNCFKLICRSSSTEMFNKVGLLLLYFSIELPEPFARDKMPQASIIVSRTWKLRFTSNSIFRSGTGLTHISLASHFGDICKQC